MLAGFSTWGDVDSICAAKERGVHGVGNLTRATYANQRMTLGSIETRHSSFLHRGGCVGRMVRGRE